MPRSSRQPLDLAAHIGTRQMVCIHRTRVANKRVSGYVLAASPCLVLLHPFHDFLPDGYTVIRTEHIESVECGSHEQHWDSMLAGEGLLGDLDAAPSVDLSSMSAALTHAAAIYRFVIIECEDRRTDDEDFLIGEVLAIDGGIVEFRHFDALGRWCDMPARVVVNAITMVQFNTPYIRHFTKYLEVPSA